MRVAKATIMTLASITAGNFSESVIAAPTNTSTPTKTTNSVVIPVIEVTRQRVETIAQPETVDAPQFSQNTVNVQSRASNNSTVVVGKDAGRSGEVEKAPVPIPVPSFSAARAKAPVPIPVPAVASPTPAKSATIAQAPVAIPVPAVGSRTAAKPVTPVKKPTPTSPAPNVTVPSAAPTINDENLVVPAIDIQIVGANQELQNIIREVIKTQVGGETSKAQLQQDVAAILDTKLFTSARVNSTTTKDGLRIVYQVQPLVVRSLQLSGAKALTYKVALEPFQNQINQPVSPTGLQEAVKKINKWYKDNGYSLARVISILPDNQGILTVNVAEGLVSDIKFKFVNDKGETVDSQGKAVTGRTKTDFIRKQLKLKSGDIFRDDVVRKDVQQLYASGLFESVNLTLEGDATKTDVVYELKEMGARSINVGGSYNADQGILGTLNYQDRNVGGINDTLSANVQVGRRDFLFDSTFNSPYRITDPNRNGYAINIFRKRGLSEVFDGDIKLANGDRIREGKIGGSVSFQRPIDDWDASLGFNYTRVSMRDRDGNISSQDEQGNPLTLSGTGIDDLATVSFTATKDERDNPLNPTNGSILKLSTEQSVPLGNGNISMNRLQANYSQYTPVQVYKSQKPQVFALNVQAGTVLGDLPPYEAFNIGGPNSVRGYGSGDVGSARTYVLASAEYRFPILQALGGVVFADLGSDLGSGDTVTGNPAGVRNKPGIGFGYGAGIRFDSPLGLLRADYGINDQGESRLHFGVGHRF
ncbi:BamA/TamA family outer membrane protein [Calothrix sp. UHCC 0171]|uniref:BamA/TamA family outer membrane protein n=1 Tax=Calothrix sp. UHCC 0171 TaxID=3110245 RepID=UPI002B202F3B|nr:BamA/TamA family outer membrane protein [Calothrix sp. UHCC 0171]MEA5571785.1 BamA/TamA family outer membrane protein [Calothrix sp. UHCC 0171]